MKSSTKITLYIVFCLVIVGIGVLISLIQEGKIKVSADIVPQTETTIAPTVSNFFLTGSNFWINLIIIIMLIASVGYFLFRSREFKAKKK